MSGRFDGKNLRISRLSDSPDRFASSGIKGRIPESDGRNVQISEMMIPAFSPGTHYPAESRPEADWIILIHP
jgi:hypothetical protein